MKFYFFYYIFMYRFGTKLMSNHVNYPILKITFLIPLHKLI